MPYLRNRIDALKAEAINQCNEKDNSPPPVKEQLKVLLGSLHPTQLDRPWVMQDFIVRLTGKYRMHPHGQEVGSALRSLGWKRVRLWKNGDGGCRVWLPPKLEK